MVVVRLVWGLASGGLAAAILYVSPFSEKRRIDASWTTTLSPSVKWDSNWDRREPSNLVKPVKRLGIEDENACNENVEINKPTAVRHLFLIRHGQYVMSGRTDFEKILTPLGQEQANLTGKRLKELGFSYTRIVQSTMTRAKQTAKIIHNYLPEVPVEECELLREGAPTPPEPPIGHWRPELHQFYEDGARIEAAFRKYFHRAMPGQKEDSYEILVCHANVIRYFILRALQLPPEAWLRFMLFNCSMTSVTIRPSGRVLIYAVGDSGHIPPDKLTTS